MKRLLPLLVVFVLAGCYVRHTAIEDGSAKIAGSKKMVSVAYHTGPATITVQLKDDEHDLRQLRPVQDSVVVISDSGTHYVLSYDPLSVRYNGSSKYYESFGEKIWMSFDFAHPRIAGAPELQDLPIGHYTMRLAFSGVPSAPEAKIEFTLVKKDTKVNWAFK